MAQTTEQKGIEFQLTLTREQYEVLEFLSKLRGKTTIQEYIHENMIRGIQSSADNSEDQKEREYAYEVLATESSQVSMDERVILHGFYESDNPGQLSVIAAAAKTMNGSPKELLEWVAISLALADLDHLSNYFEKGKHMEEVLEEI